MTSKGTQQSPNSNRSSYFFIFLVKYIEQVTTSDTQSDLKVKFSILKGSQIINTLLKQPVLITFENGYARSQKLSISFFIKQSGQHNLHVKMYTVNDGDETYVGYANLDQLKYISSLLNQNNNRTDQEITISQYRVGYCIFIDKDRHNLQKIVKAYKKTQGFMLASPNLYTKQFKTPASQQQKPLRSDILNVKQFNQNQTSQKTQNYTMYEQQNKQHDKKDEEKEKIQQNSSKIQHKQQKLNSKVGKEQNQRSEEDQNKDDDESKNENKNKAQNKTGQNIQQSVIQQNYRIIYSQKKNEMGSKQRYLSESPYKKQPQIKHFQNEQHQGYQEIQDPVQQKTYKLQSKNAHDNKIQKNDTQSQQQQIDLLNGLSENLNHTQRLNPKKQTENKNNDVVIDPTQSIIQQTKSERESKSQFINQRVQKVQSQQKQTNKWKLTFKILIILIMLGFSLLCVKTYIFPDTSSLKKNTKNKTQQKKTKSAKKSNKKSK